MQAFEDVSCVLREATKFTSVAEKINGKGSSERYKVLMTTREESIFRGRRWGVFLESSNFQ